VTVQIHRSTLLSPPHRETPVAIDDEMVPVIRAIWAHGWQTAGCCQDTGEATEGERGARGFPSEPTGNAGFIEYYRGWAWLKMPQPDAFAFLTFVADCAGFQDRVTVRWGRGSWRMHTPVVWSSDGFAMAAYTQIHLPREQLVDLATALG
jgi:hypothetical protein